MKPKQLPYPYLFGAIKDVLIRDRVLYYPERFSRSREPFAFPGWTHDSVFGNDNPVHVEYCSGNGAWIVAKAKEHPQINWVAVEVKFKRVRKIWSKAKNYGLTNLFIVCGEGQEVTRSCIASDSVCEAYINFPDPWPKFRHAKNRIVNDDFIGQLSRVLQPKVSLFIVTDHGEFSNGVIKAIDESKGFKSYYPDPYYTVDCEGYGSSYFEELWREQGKTIRYHRYINVKGHHRDHRDHRDHRENRGVTPF